MTPAPKSPHTSYPSTLMIPIPVAKSRSAPTALPRPALGSPRATHFFWPGTDTILVQDEEDDALIQQIRSRSSLVLPKDWNRISQDVRGVNSKPTLPDALLSKIFNLSVHVAGAVDIKSTEDIHHFTQLHIWVAGHPDFAVSRHTGYSLMRLSKHWHSATRKYPYRYIRIRSSKQLETFVKLLKEGPHCDEAGDWVQRLDLIVNTSWKWEKKDGHLLNAIFTMCPNLTCFSTIGSSTLPIKFGLPALLANISRIAPSLRRLELAADQHALRALHNSHTDRVEVLWITSTTTAIENKDKVVLSFPGVRALFAGTGTENWVRNFHLPSLRAVVMEDSEIKDIPATVEPKMLEHISLAGSWDMTQFNDFTELKSISFKYSEISHHPINWPQQMSSSLVSCVTIYDMSTGWNNNESSRVLQDNFLMLISEQNFPDLERIRLLVAVDMAGEPHLPSAMKGFWKNLVAICNGMGKVIEVLPDGRCTSQRPISLDSVL